MKADLESAIEALQNMVLPLRLGEFSVGLGKVSVYVQSVAKSHDSYRNALQALEQKRAIDPEGYGRAKEALKLGFQKSLQNSLSFSRRNLDNVLVQALGALVYRPRNPTKTDEQKKSDALKKTFDRLTSPQEAMLEHYRASSDPLNKYLVAGPWGHQYLQKRKIDLEEYDRRLCEMLACQDTLAGRIVLSYTRLCRAIDEVEERANQAVD
jgi:uncharacterized membrane-anchored protein YhcB (DUF1043 family)